MPATDQILLPNVTANATASTSSAVASVGTAVDDFLHSATHHSGSSGGGSISYALTNTTISLSITAIDDLTTTPLAALAATIYASAASSLAPSPSNSNDCRLATNDLADSDSSLFGIQLAVPEWEAIFTAIILTIIILLTIVGNILVILSVFTYKPLRIVQNFFIVSLAVADLTVALLVLPFNVAYSILGRWEFGIHVCKMWLTCDVMCCTSSILNLCAIALDRYWAITDPINYAQKRTVGRVLLLIAGVWILSLVISSPPLLGWNDWPAEFTSASPCELNSDPGYVIYSSLGSFFIPLAIMTIVYVEIYIATRRRLRERAKATKITTIALKQRDYEAALQNDSGQAGGGGGGGTSCGFLCMSVFSCCCRAAGKQMAAGKMAMLPTEGDSISSETHAPLEEDDSVAPVAEQQVVVVTERKKSKRAVIKDSIKHGKTRGHNKQLVKPDSARGSGKNKLLLPASTGAEGGKKSKQLMEDNEKSSSSEQATQGVEQMAIELQGDQTGITITAPSIGRQTMPDNSDETSSLKNTTPPQSSTGIPCSTAVANNNTQQTPSVAKKPSGVYQFIEEKQKISLSKERRAARTLGIIMGVFVICWLPFFLMYVILPFCRVCCPTTRFKNFITWLGYINSGLNPVIYTIFNLDYRRAFKRLLGIH